MESSLENIMTSEDNAACEAGLLKTSEEKAVYPKERQKTSVQERQPPNMEFSGAALFEWDLPSRSL